MAKRKENREIVLSERTQAKFWRKVRKLPGGCWEWAGSQRGFGYGLFTQVISGRVYKLSAHRVSYTLAFGPVPPGAYVLHACNNPSCVNPAHLRCGTQADNIRDQFVNGRRNSPTPVRRPPRLTTEEMFWVRVEKTATCWLWHGVIRPDGYGNFSPTPRKIIMAHRFSYTLTHGPIPPNMVIMHTCDTPACVNPSHLRIGTLAENTRDTWVKGRAKPGRFPKGSAHWRAKFTEDEILRIRHLHDTGQATLAELTKQYNVWKSTMFCIVHRRTWKDVT